MTPLLTVDQAQNVRKFVYHGGDSSLLYKFVLSPLAQTCVDWFTPVWLAPNVITTIGLLFNIFAACLTLAYNPEFDANDADVGWLAMVSAVCMFLYQTFDNIDGKQARKTNSSSPLGVLFDHGCDAINVCLSIIPISSALGLGWSDRSIMVFALIPLVPFFSQTWELYHVKSMVLPIINGPSEGLVIAISMMLTTYYTGSAQWYRTAYHVNALGREVVPGELLMVVAATGAAGTCFFNVLNVIRKQAGELQAARHSLVGVLCSFLPFAVYYVSLMVWLWHSEVALTPPYRWWTLLLGSSVFIELVSHINLMHIVDGTMQPGERYLVGMIVLLAVAVLPEVRPHVPAILGERTVLVPFALLAAGLTVRLLHLMNVEVANALNIYVFVMGRKSIKDKKF